MATISVLTASAMPGGAPGRVDEAADAMINAADKYSRGLGARASGPAHARAPHGTEPAAADLDARRGQARAADREMLPQGFFPIGETRDLTLLGRWPLLEDRMTPCLPARIVAAMEHRCALGDRDAETWLKMHARACAGDPAAQRAFGRVCENGAYRASADLQRAFFWYYRAGLQGDDEARRNAERLMRSTRISRATLAEPVLIHPGQWRITAHLSEQLRAASLFDLDSDGTATGSLLGNSRATAGSARDAQIAADDPGSDDDAPTPLSPMRKGCYRGGWAYDGMGRILTIIFDVSDGGERRWRSASWQIALLGCKPGAIFGRDRRMVGYTLEHLPQGAAREE